MVRRLKKAYGFAEYMSDLRSQTISGLSWSGGGQGLRLILNFAISVILARLLTPEDFGLIGMIAIFTGFVQLFTELGLGAAIIQKPDLAERHRSTVFWVNLQVGLLLTILVAALAPLLATFYDEPALLGLTVVIALNFLLGSLGIVQRALLRKQMAFRRLFVVNIVAAILAGAVAITMALVGYGVWSLVAQLLVRTIVSAVMLWFLTPWKPKWLFNVGGLKELLGFSSNLLGFSAINYWARNMDNLLIGRIIGSAALGIYSRAYSIMLLPLTQISAVMTQVMFPVLSSIQGDLALTRRVYLRATRSIALLSFPLMVGLLVVADSFVLVVYGEQWAEVIPLLRIFCLAGLMQSVGTTVGWIYTSQGRTDQMFKWGVFSGVVRGVSFVVGLQWGVIGVAVAYFASGLLLWFPSWAIPGRLINLRVGLMVRNLAGVLLAAVAMGVLVLAVRHVLPTFWPEWVRLAGFVAVGAMSYLGLVHLFQLDAYRDVRAIVSERVQLIIPSGYFAKRGRG